MEGRLNLIGEHPERTIERLRPLGLSLLGARRVLSALVNRGEPDLARVRDVPIARRAAIEAKCDVPSLRIVERRVDPADAFAKYLLETHDGLKVEAVRIPLLPKGVDAAAALNSPSQGGTPVDASAFNDRHRFTICLSSEAGCGMGCGFCATAKLGLQRKLEAWEIVAQVLAVRKEAPGRISGAVFMGMGEPFSNYDSVMTAINVMSHPLGLAISGGRITVSTVGLVPQIRRFTAERRKERLAVSLFSAVEETRRAWVPIAQKHDLRELREALVEHCAAGRRPLVAITLISGVNTSLAEARAVAAFCRGLPVGIDLIEVNDTQGALRAPTRDERSAYIDTLREAERPIQVRYSGGQAIEAGCGMLAATRAGGRTVLPTLGTLSHPRIGAGPLPLPRVED